MGKFHIGRHDKQITQSLEISNYSGTVQESQQLKPLFSDILIPQTIDRIIEKIVEVKKPVYIDRHIEKIVEVPIYVEKIMEKNSSELLLQIDDHEDSLQNLKQEVNSLDHDLNNIENDIMEKMIYVDKRFDCHREYDKDIESQIKKLENQLKAPKLINKIILGLLIINIVLKFI